MRFLPIESPLIGTLPTQLRNFAATLSHHWQEVRNPQQQKSGEVSLISPDTLVGCLPERLSNTSATHSQLGGLVARNVTATLYQQT